MTDLFPDAPDLTAQPESRWTQASDLCPHPERWSSTDDDSTEVEVSEMIAGFVQGLQPTLVIETGTAWGQTAELIGEALLRNGQGTLISYDVDDQRVGYSRERCGDLPVVEIRQQSSVVGLEELIGEGVKAEVIFLDSLFDLRMVEIEQAAQLLTPGGIVLIHDTAPHHTLWESLQQACLLDGWRWINLPTPRGLAILQRGTQ